MQRPDRVDTESRSQRYNENWADDSEQELMCARPADLLEKTQVSRKKELNLQLVGAVAWLVHAMALFK